MEIERPFEVILIGDTGAPLLERPDPVMEAFRSEIPAHSNSAIVFLGDLVYPVGIPPIGHRLREVSEKRLLLQLDIVKNFTGKLIFLSGNHDWNVGRKNGIQFVQRQEEFIEDYFKGRDVCLPSLGCPGPDALDLSSYFSIVAVNSQWWVQNGLRPAGASYGCKVNSEEEFFKLLDATLNERKEKRTLIIGHHPIYSYGAHGGFYGLRHHIFPLTMYRKKWWVPLPLLGTMVALYRKFFGAKEDLAHPRYRRFRHGMKKVMLPYKNLFYAAGHEHNLQHIYRDEAHYIVSGSATKVQALRKGRFAHYAAAEKGFFKMIIYPNRNVELLAFEVDFITAEKTLAYKMVIPWRA